MQVTMCGTLLTIFTVSLFLIEQKVCVMVISSLWQLFCGGVFPVRTLYHTTMLLVLGVDKYTVLQ